MRRKKYHDYPLIFMLFALMICVILIISSLYFKIDRLELENETLKLQIEQSSKVPDGFNVVYLTPDGYTDEKPIEPIQTISNAEKSLKTDVVSRGDVERKSTSVVTAYTWTGNKTAIGTYPVQGRTCAGPRWIPLGTVVYIEGVGERIVEDRTNIRYNGRYDVYMNSEDDCLEFGIQNLKVEVLK